MFHKMKNRPEILIIENLILSFSSSNRTHMKNDITQEYLDNAENWKTDGAFPEYFSSDGIFVCTIIT